VNALNCRNSIFLPLITAGIMLAVLLGSVQAAVLKDIRIGEYKGFTRIVFELDQPAVPAQIQQTALNRLAVVFAHATADLIRKIPIERSRHVKDLQIWQRKESLSAVLFFDFGPIRHEVFTLINPPRLVVDIHPDSSAPAPALSNNPPVPDDVQNRPAGPELDAKKPEPPTIQPVSPPPPEKEQAADIKSMPPDTPGKLAAAEQPAMTGPDHPEVKLRDNTAGTTAGAVPPSPPAAPRPPPHRLQFYLVLALVLITIAILVLLLLMLFSRHRWADDKTPLSNKELLQNQEKHIASLNARIQEQLKRYEEV
jgi:hypothetical protein